MTSLTCFDSIMDDKERLDKLLEIQPKTSIVAYDDQFELRLLSPINWEIQDR